MRRKMLWTNAKGDMNGNWQHPWPGSEMDLQGCNRVTGQVAVSLECDTLCRFWALGISTMSWESRLWKLAWRPAR